MRYWCLFLCPCEYFDWHLTCRLVICKSGHMLSCPYLGKSDHLHTYIHVYTCIPVHQCIRAQLPYANGQLKLFVTSARVFLVLCGYVPVINRKYYSHLTLLTETYIYLYIHDMYIYMYIYVYICININIYIYIYIYNR